MLSSSGFNAAIACCRLDGCRSEKKLSWLWRVGTRDDETRGRSTQRTDRCCWLRERFSGSSAGRPWPLPCVGEELLRGREKTRKKTAGAAAVFGLRKKGTAAGLCWVELETVRLREGWEEDSGVAAVFGLRKQGAAAGLVSCVSGRCYLGNQRGSRRCWWGRRRCCWRFGFRWRLVWVSGWGRE